MADPAAVLARLQVLEANERAGLLRDAWRLSAPKPLQAKHPEV